MLDYAWLFLAGLLGGMVNAVAGGGSFITFPALIAVGIPPIVANATNTFASCAGYCSGAIGFRHELWRHRKRLLLIVLCALGGGIAGAGLLLRTSPDVFQKVVPWLLLVAAVLLVYGERLQQALRRRFANHPRLSAAGTVSISLLLLVVCIYGGFFNAGLGIILLGYLTLAGYQDIHLMNGIKLMISAVIALVAIALFSVGDLIAWREGSAVLLGTLVGGYSAVAVVKLVSQHWVRRFITATAILMTAFFFNDAYGLLS